MAVVVEAKAGREAKCPVRRKIPGNYRGEIVRGLVQAKAVTVAESAIHFDSGDEVFAAETATLGRRFESQGMAGAECVAELPGVAAGEVLGGNGVLSDVPSLEGLGEKQFEFEFVIMLLTGTGVRVGVVRFDVVAFHFLENLVGAAGVFVFDIKDWIDEMFALEQAEAVLESESGEDGAVVECGLAVEVELGGPPGSGAVFELGPEGVKIVAGALGAERGEVFDFEAAGFLEIVIVGDDVGALLGSGGESGRKQEQDDKDREGLKSVRQAELEFLSGAGN